MKLLKAPVDFTSEVKGHHKFWLLLLVVGAQKVGAPYSKT